MQTKEWNTTQLLEKYDAYVADPLGTWQKLKHWFWIRLGFPGVLTPRMRSRKIKDIKYLRPGLLYTLRPKGHNASMKKNTHFYTLMGKTIKKEVRKK